jgi:hypothetical protein
MVGSRPLNRRFPLVRQVLDCASPTTLSERRASSQPPKAPEDWRTAGRWRADGGTSANGVLARRGQRRFSFFCAGALLLVTCAGLRADSNGTNTPGRRILDWIEVSPDKHGFVCASSGRPFIPWGFNYDRDYKSRLLEDYWVTEWPTVVEDFREIKQLGANVVRVHLQFARFMESADRPNDKALEQLGRLVNLAEETGLYLDLTGLGCYRKQDVPAWYSGLGETRRWAAQARFWEAIAARCADSPALFCYDLMNEPIVPGGKRTPGDWLTGELGGFNYCQFISLDQANRPRPEIARVWISRLVAAIRKHDQRHLITVGLLPDSLEAPESVSGFVPGKVSRDLDFVCVHIYPKTGHLDQDLKLLQGFAVGKPVVIEETFPLTCTAKELGQFIEGSRKHAAGWLGFYWGQTPNELSKSASIGDSLMAAWLKLFGEMHPN